MRRFDVCAGELVNDRLHSAAAESEMEQAYDYLESLDLVMI
jgi:hypothetical protein